MSIRKKDGMVVVVDDSCPIASAMAANIFSGERRKKMPNFVSAAFGNAIESLPEEINADFVKKVAEIAKKVISYERTDWPWGRSDRKWLYKGHRMGKLIELSAQVAPDRESFLIFVGVVLSEDEWFSRDGSEAVKSTMHHLRDVLLANIKNREEATVVAEYAGSNGKAGILMSWFPPAES